jgi:ATP-dependent exoDNAse (exonuclease V) beta subunit
MTTPFNILTSPIAPGTTLVEAGAGTGKTLALTRTVLRLVLDGTPDSGFGQAGKVPGSTGWLVSGQTFERWCNREN